MKNKFSLLLLMILLVVLACKKERLNYSTTQTVSQPVQIPTALNGTRIFTGIYTMLQGNFDHPKTRLDSAELGDIKVSFKVDDSNNQSMDVELFLSDASTIIKEVKAYSKSGDSIHGNAFRVLDGDEVHLFFSYDVINNNVYSLYCFIDTISDDYTQFNHEYVLKEKN